MERFAAMVRIGDPEENKTEAQVAAILALHVEEGCWTSTPDRELRRGMPIIASHTGAGSGQFLVGISTGERMEIPWETAPEHEKHVGYGVTWFDAVFECDPELIPGAKGRSVRYLTTEEFNAAWARLTVAADRSPVVAGP
jgi:hypothetical protein